MNSILSCGFEIRLTRTSAWLSLAKVKIVLISFMSNSLICAIMCYVMTVKEANYVQRHGNEFHYHDSIVQLNLCN